MRGAPSACGARMTRSTSSTPIGPIRLIGLIRPEKVRGSLRTPTATNTPTKWEISLPCTFLSRRVSGPVEDQGRRHATSCGNPGQRGRRLGVGRCPNGHTVSAYRADISAQLGILRQLAVSPAHRFIGPGCDRADKRPKLSYPRCPMPRKKWRGTFLLFSMRATFSSVLRLPSLSIAACPLPAPWRTSQGADGTSVPDPKKLSVCFPPSGRSATKQSARVTTAVLRREQRHDSAHIILPTRNSGYRKRLLAES